MDYGATVHYFLMFAVRGGVEVPQKPNFQIADHPDGTQIQCFPTTPFEAHLSGALIEVKVDRRTDPRFRGN